MKKRPQQFAEPLLLRELETQQRLSNRIFVTQDAVTFVQIPSWKILAGRATELGRVQGRLCTTQTVSPDPRKVDLALIAQQVGEGPFRISPKGLSTLPTLAGQPFAWIQPTLKYSSPICLPTPQEQLWNL